MRLMLQYVELKTDANRCVTLKQTLRVTPVTGSWPWPFRVTWCHACDHWTCKIWWQT